MINMTATGTPNRLRKNPTSKGCKLVVNSRINECIATIMIVVRNIQAMPCTLAGRRPKTDVFDTFKRDTPAAHAVWLCAHGDYRNMAGIM
jgi:hypothetical protein